MQRPVDTKNPAEVAAETRRMFREMFAHADERFVDEAFGWAKACFAGEYAQYQPVDLGYHDFEHTLQGTLGLVRLLHGRHKANAAPPLTERLFQLGLIAILLHDTGYLKTRDDREGTGAKYTLTHVGRSADFAAALLSEKGFRSHDIQAVQYMIRCTGVDARPDAIPFRNDLERMIGLALATADLLGQMAAPDYVSKLPALYEEFSEAVRFSNDHQAFIASFNSAENLIERTPSFWDNVVKRKLEEDFRGLYRFLNEPYPEGPNKYIERIEANIALVRSQWKEAPEGVPTAS
jgi:hypothetical protein